MIEWSARNQSTIKGYWLERAPVLSSHHLKDNPRALRTCTSLDRSAFATVLPSCEVAWHAYVYDHHITKQTRQRRCGGGRKARLASAAETVWFLLIAFTVSPLQEVMASLCAMRQGRVNAWIHTRSAVLTRAVGHAHCVPERDPQHLEQVFAMGVSVDCLIDGTARPVHRPQDPVQQPDHERGKKKRLP